MARVDVYLSLGSNLGDRRENLLRALALLDAALGRHYAAVSGFLETAPAGFSGGMFLNAAVRYRLPRPEGDTEACCLDLLRRVKEVERTMGRTDPPEYDAAGRRVYHSRIIDVDILFYGKETVDTAEITVPHKAMAERPFVLLPLREIATPSLRKAFPAFFTSETI